MEAFAQTHSRYDTRPESPGLFTNFERSVVFVSIEHDKHVKSEERLGRSEKSPMGIRPLRKCYRCIIDSLLVQLEMRDPDYPAAMWLFTES